MEIKRIKEIQNIGAFACFKNGASYGFEKLTFIYGLNTFGKTTLTDVFQSLKENRSEIINIRKTIPEQTESQKVIFSLSKIFFIPLRFFKANSLSSFSLFLRKYLHPIFFHLS